MYSTTGLQTDYGYDNNFGNLILSTVSGYTLNTRSSTASYDAYGEFMVGACKAQRQCEGWTYDPRFGTPASHTDVNDLITNMTYDGFGRPTLEVRPDQNRTAISYAYCSGVNGGTAACNSLTYGAFRVTTTPQNSSGSQNGAQTIAYYDSLGRSIAGDVQGFDGAWIRSAAPYNDKGWVEKTSRPYFRDNGDTPRWTVNTYDTIGRVIRADQPDTGYNVVNYQGMTTVTTAHIYNPITTAWTTEATTTTKSVQGVPTSVTDALGNTTTYWYDSYGNLTKIVDAAGNITMNSYNVRGFRTGSTDPDMGIWLYRYDSIGNLIYQNDAKSQATTLSYDLLNRLVGAVEGSFTRTFTYDSATNGVGLLASTASTDGTSRAFAYDSISRPITSTLTVDSATYVTSTSYNSDGRIYTLSYPSGFVARYAYGSYGDLAQILDNASGSTLWQANGRDAELHLISQAFGNGVSQTNTFNANTGLLSNIRAGTNDGVANFDYTFDTIGNLLYRADGDLGVFEYFCYDGLNRLTEYAAGTGVTACSSSLNHKTLTYNAIGNIVTKSDVGTYSYPSAGSSRPHAVSNITGTVNGVVNPSYTYDANGNMTAGLSVISCNWA